MTKSGNKPAAGKKNSKKNERESDGDLAP